MRVSLQSRSFLMILASKLLTTQGEFRSQNRQSRLRRCYSELCSIRRKLLTRGVVFDRRLSRHYISRLQSSYPGRWLSRNSFIAGGGFPRYGPYLVVRALSCCQGLSCCRYLLLTACSPVVEGVNEKNKSLVRLTRRGPLQDSGFENELI